MKITVINGTEVKGCTYHLKESFLDYFRNDHEIIQYYLPKDCPKFCIGCKVCFMNDENLCPHSKFTMPIWNSILESELIVFTYPVYALRAPAQVKALLDHLCCHWMVHRPDKKMFDKHAVILTQSIGAPNTTAQKDVVTSLTWLGVSNIKRLGFGLMEGVVWDEISEKRRTKMVEKTKQFARKIHKVKKVKKSLKVRLFFTISKMIHKKTLKMEAIPSADNQHWINNGWIVLNKNV